MKPSLKLLGIIAMLASPFLWLETYFYGKAMHNTTQTGLCDLVYMLGWMCSIFGLLKQRAAGGKAGKMILYIQLVLLTIANIWNVWVIFDALNKSSLFSILDKFWPASNLFMITTGIAVIVAKRLGGFYRFTPLIAGLWLPVTALFGKLLQGKDPFFLIMNGYSVISFFLLGLTIFLQKEMNADRRK